MAGKIRASDIEEVKSRANIADIIGEHVQLRNASVGSLKGLCPFHDEKSPSFNVRPSQGFYHCFGCGEGGDVYKFLQQLESLSFTEAVEKVAARIGFTLTYEEGGAPSNSGAKSRILEANSLAAAFYQDQLQSTGAQAGREFLLKRGFDQAAWAHFGLGYAPKEWSALTDYLKSKGFTVDELVQAGLASPSDKGGYDKFRGRLVWPIKDAGSAVIGFGARKLYDDDNGPKYLNTSDTMVYHKSTVLYGIDLARKDISKQQQVVVVEGYTDVMACHLAGITTAVATCGTAFGDDHIRILNRMLNSGEVPAEVIFTFDPDAAGQKAAMRAFEDSHKFSAQTFVAVGPDGLDPCDLRQARGDQAVQLMIQARRPLFEFAIKQKLAKFNLNSLEGRVAAARAAAPVIAQIRDAALRPAYVRELADWVNLPIDDINRITQEAQKSQRAAAVADLRTDVPPPPEEQAGPSSGSVPSIDPRDPVALAEQRVLQVLIQCPQAFDQAQLGRIIASGMSAPIHNIVLRALGDALGLEANTWLGRLELAIPSQHLTYLRSLAAAPLPAANPQQLDMYAKGVVTKALINCVANEKAQLLAALRRANPEAPEHKEIQQRLVQLEVERRQLLGD
ncbi:MAG: DNA primase [Micrococcales bacterium]